MGNVKDLLIEINALDSRNVNEDTLEVYADSVEQALELAAEEFDTDIENLDYSILEKGTPGFFGIGRTPYHVLVNYIHANEGEIDIDLLDKKLSSHVVKNENASFKIRVLKSGIWLTVYPPKGNGRSLNVEQVKRQFNNMRIENIDAGVLEKAVKKMSGKAVRLGDSVPDPKHDGKMSVDISSDEMKVYVHFIPPRYNGRHLEYEEVMNALRSVGVTYGYKDQQIQEYLENMNYTQPLLAAAGDPPVDGTDAYIDYRVHIDKSNIQFEEDENGKVDFRNLYLLENVTTGQLLAVKIPAGEGVAGRTVFGRIIPVRKGKDLKIQYGKGTILSDDGIELTAEINGQVVFKQGVISVESVYTVKGDVGLQSGNIIFLGSVLVTGNVQDNFVVKASGNIEVKGTVEKAFLEAEGDIIVYQGITGRNEARVESTDGSVFAKFIQNANIFAEKDIFSPEGVLHSNIGAGDRIICNGKRARIVGGSIMAENEVNSHVIGASVSTKTVVNVGVHPKILQKITELEAQKEEYSLELEKINKDVTTLTHQKASGKLNEEKENMFTEMTERKQYLESEINEIDADLEEHREHVANLERKGKVCVEDTIYPGVELNIYNEKFVIRDEYHNTKFFLNEDNNIDLSEYEKPDIPNSEMPIKTIGRRKWR